MIQQTVSAADRGQRLDKYIKRTLPGAGSSFLYKMLRKKNIVLNNSKADGREILETGDVITYWFSEETYARFAGEAAQESHQSYLDAYHQLSAQYPTLRVIEEQSELAFICKPAGVLSQKAKDSDVSVNEWFVGYLMASGQLPDTGSWSYTPSVCNRLDRNTGGIVICAKTLQGSHAANAILRDRSVHKYYQMVVAGRLTGAGSIHLWTRKDPDTNVVRVYHQPAPGAAETYTRYHAIRYSKRNDMTLVEAELVTGRTHQLRVHCSEIGHPIIGDPKYGDPARRRREIPYQLLWSWRLELPAFPEPELADLSGRTILCTPPALYEELTR